MNVSKTLSLIAAVLSFGLLVVFVQKNNSWKNIFQKDLKAIYDILSENHPGFYNDQNPKFKEWLNTGYQHALSKSDAISSFADYIYALSFFVNGFKDNHLRINFDKSFLKPEWPGFCIDYQKGKFLVVHSEKNDIPLNAELISCDGESPQEWLEKNILPYIDARHIEASWFVAAPYLSLWEGTIVVSKPKKYTFKINNGIQEVDATWKKISSTDYFSKFPKKNLKQQATIRELRPNQVWISIPSFYPQTQQEEDALNSIINSISHYAIYNLIVFDVRGNTGGNSYYGSRILKNLYGEEYYNASLKNIHNKKYVEWRTSTGNIKYMKELIIKLEKQFGKGEIVSVFSDIISGMQRSQLAGNPFYRKMNSSKETEELQNIRKPLHAHIVVITDSYCASACLDFLDELFTLDSVFHIGLATNADTDYMECRDIQLPSSLAILHFPIKVFRNRIRKANEAYVPQCRVDDIYNDIPLKEVIQKIILQ